MGKKRLGEAERRLRKEALEFRWINNGPMFGFFILHKDRSAEVYVPDRRFGKLRVIADSVSLTDQDKEGFIKDALARYVLLREV